MRRLCLGIAGALLACTFAGCGESEPEGPVQYKGTNSPDIDKLSEIMSKNQKTKVFTTKQTEAKPADKKAAEKKPGESKPANK
jgi:hypothetical protein